MHLEGKLCHIKHFRYPTISDIEYFGGKLITMCTWSFCTFFSSISIFLQLHNDSSASFTVRLTAPSSTLYRYFGHQTKWYLHSHITCANFLNRFIFTSLSFSGSPFPYDKEVLSIPPPTINDNVKPTPDHRLSRWFMVNN